MRALITGGAGFIGNHLGKYLENRGYEIIYLDNLKWSTFTPHNCVIGDILQRDILDFIVEQVDEVYHLAAQINVDYANEHPYETISINQMGTFNVLEACRKHKKRIVFASTSEVYGSSQSEYMSESHPLDAQGIYAASKVAGDRLCKAYVDAYGMDIKILRNFNTFGPLQRWDSYGGVIAKFTDRALKGKPPIIYGDGTQQRDYMWIDDAVRAYELIMEKGKSGEPINFGTGKTVSVNEIAHLICELTGCPDPVYTQPRPGEVKRLCADISKARKLGFEPMTDFRKHLTEYVQWKKTQIQ